MGLYNAIKTACIFYLSLSYASSLKPSKLPSGKGRVYKYNRNYPETDLKRITPAEASFVSRHWLNNILQPKQICEEDALIIENINGLEQLIQEQFTRHHELDMEYFVWTPQGITEDILFIIVLEVRENKNILRMLINSPFWESKQINVDCLLASLKGAASIQNKTLDIQSFLSNNVRYKLIWKDFKRDSF